MKKICIICFNILLFPLCFGSNKDYEFAKTLQGKVKETATKTKESDHPTYKDYNQLNELKYYNSGSGLKEQAKQHAAKDENSQFIIQTRAKRPEYEIDPKNDPLFKRYEEISEKADVLADQDSSQECVDLPVGNEDLTKYEKKSCLETGSQDITYFSCRKSLNVTCSNANAGTLAYFNPSDFSITGPHMTRRNTHDTFSFGDTHVFRNGHCTPFINDIYFYISDPKDIEKFIIGNISYDDWLDIEMNGHLLFRAYGPHVGTHLTSHEKQCDYYALRPAPPIDAKTYLRSGSNHIRVINTVGGGGNAHLSLITNIKYACRSKDLIPLTSCDNGENPYTAQKISSKCIEGSGTRLIKGTPIWRSCWKWKEDYKRVNNPIFKKEPLCRQLLTEGCIQKNSVCEEYGNGFCKRNRIYFACPFLVPAKTIRVCKNVMNCPGGDCSQKYGREQLDQTENFKQAATNLQAANEISKDLRDQLVKNISDDKLSLFKGEGLECKNHKYTGFKNCCTDHGWGMGIGLAKCKAHEKKLGIAKEEGRSIFIGEYKTGGPFDRRKYKSYCTYPSKLARVIIEQGKKQLGHGFGSARNPDCRGLTTEEFKRVDFSKINFSEVIKDYQGSVDAYNVPNNENLSSQMNKSLKKKIQVFQQENKKEELKEEAQRKW